MSPPREHYHHGNLREALVDAARCMLDDVGVAGLSLRKVAKHAGVSQAAPYHHFPNKDALLAEVALAGFNALTHAMEETFAANEDPVDRVQALGRVYVDFGLQNQAVYRLMFGAEYCPGEEFPKLQEAGTCAFGVLMRCIAAGQEQGAFIGEEPGSVSMAVWSSMHGLVSLLQAKFHTSKDMGPLKVTPEMFVESTLAFVTGGLTG